jgi:anti-anti-sigma regulatory factor
VLSVSTQSPKSSPVLARRVGFRHVLTPPGGRFGPGDLPDLPEAYVRSVEQGAQEVWLDLRRVGGIRTAGLDAMARMAAFGHQFGRRTVVICPPGPLRATLERAGIAGDVEIFDSLSDAQRAC